MNDKPLKLLQTGRRNGRAYLRCKLDAYFDSVSIMQDSLPTGEPRSLSETAVEFNAPAIFLLLEMRLT